MGSRFTRIACALIGAFVLAGAPTAWAEPDARTKSAARALADEGDALWDNGSYAEAYDRFTRAYKLVPVLTLSLRRAECLEKLGKLVEASELYAEVANEPLDNDAPEVFTEAQATAQRKLQMVRERLPKLLLRVSGPYLRQSSVLVDEHEVQRVLWGVAFPVNPGMHTVELVRGDLRVTKAISIKERQSKEVELSFEEPKPVAAPVVDEPAPAPEPAPPPPTRTPVEVDSGSVGNTSSTLGWVGIGVGAAGLTVGTIAGLTALSRYDTYESSCPDDTCPESLQDDVDGYNRLRTISTVSFAVGVVAAGAGITILLTSPSEDEAESQASLRGYVGPGSVGMAGRF